MALRRKRVDPEPRASNDTRMLRQAARSITFQVAFAVALVVLIMSAVVYYVQEHQQQTQATQITRTAWATADDDADDPPVGVWLVISTSTGSREISPGAPAFVQTIDPRALRLGQTTLRRGERGLVIWTGNRGQRRVSAVFDLTPGEQEEHRLLSSLALASLLGISGAVTVGAVIGRRAVRPLGESLALQRRFVADASHELRTPLSVLQLRAQILRRQLGSSVPDAVVHEFDRLVQDTKVLGEVVNDLLLAAELEHRHQAGEPVDVNEIAAGVVHSLQPLAQQRSISLTLANDLPLDGAPEPSAGPLIVNGAPAALRRATLSLVDNAIAHSPPGGHVRVETARAGELIVVRVHDEGQGLDPAEADRLVARFSRGTSRDAGRRFGLGLSLVDEVARAHGGQLAVSGAPGRGATFSLCLPGHRAPEPVQ
jgi:two-component system, OmpR family, sensor kinase